MIEHPAFVYFQEIFNRFSAQGDFVCGICLVDGIIFCDTRNNTEELNFHHVYTNLMLASVQERPPAQVVRRDPLETTGENHEGYKSITDYINNFCSTQNTINVQFGFDESLLDIAPEFLSTEQLIHVFNALPFRAIFITASPREGEGFSAATLNNFPQDLVTFLGLLSFAYHRWALGLFDPHPDEDEED